MDYESSVHQSSKGLDLSKNLSHHFDGVADAKLKNPKQEHSLAPLTPEPNKENGDFPLTMVKKLAKVQSFNSKINGSEDTMTSLDDYSRPCTPKDGVFDPFAPGRKEMLLAPMCKKFLDEARASVARRLDFCSFKSMRSASYGDDVDSLSDEEMFESVYENLLEAIVTNLTEDALAEVSNFEWDSDACQTPPPSAPLLNGLADDTCPGAPLKPTGKSRTIDFGSCRKLEF